MATLKQFKAELKKIIINKAMNETINKPRLVNLEIHDCKELYEGGFLYKNATCELIDDYIHPITKKRTIDRYTVIYDGCFMMIKQ